MGAICGRCGEPREAHGGASHLGACPGESGIQAKRFSIGPEDRPRPEEPAQPNHVPLAGVDELIAWLSAIWDARERELDEDERAAQAATAGPWWHGAEGAWADEQAVLAGASDARPTCVAATGDFGDSQSAFDAEHITRWDPARVLREVTTERAEIAAKRRILSAIMKLEQPMRTTIGAPRNGRPGTWRSRPRGDDPRERLLKLLAQPYVGRPGWREEWRA
jgi:hypothetical protein